MAVTWNGAIGTSVASTNETSATSMAITMPTGVVAGELLVAFVSTGQNPANAYTKPAGWTPVFGTAGHGDGSVDNSNGYGIFWKVADGSESGAAVNFTWSPAGTYHMGTAFRLGGVDTANPVRAFSIPASIPTTATPTNPTATASTPPANLTGVQAADLEVYFAAIGTNGGTAQGTLTGPAGPWAPITLRDGGVGSRQKGQGIAYASGSANAADPVWSSTNTASMWSEIGIAFAAPSTARPARPSNPARFRAATW